MDNGEVIGQWEALVRPISDDLELPGRMGLTVTLPAVTAHRMGLAMVKLAQVIDTMEAARYAELSFNRLFARAVFLLGALIAAGYFLNG